MKPLSRFWNARGRLGAEIVSRLPDHLRDYRVYEALDLEGHRWRFLQWLREVPHWMTLPRGTDRLETIHLYDAFARLPRP